MNTEIILHATDYPTERESIMIIIEKNLSGKLDRYIKKYHKSEQLVRVELTLKKENDNQAAGKLMITISGKTYRSERENFDNLHDLVNHLFGHIKDQLVD
jgi:hypothetical protein